VPPYRPLLPCPSQRPGTSLFTIANNCLLTLAAKFRHNEPMAGIIAAKHLLLMLRVNNGLRHLFQTECLYFS